MKRIIVLTALVVAGAMSYLIAQEQGQKPRVVVVEKLKDNLFVLKGDGGGGNTTVFVQSNGITVVDTKNPGWGAPILEKIKELSPKPVTTIINTHTHGDHVSGNVEFPATVDIVVQENTATNMKQMRAVTGIAKPGAPPATNIFEQHKGHGLPKRTFKDQMTLFKGPDQVELYYFGRGHTNGDAWVLFPTLRVVSAGDIISGQEPPAARCEQRRQRPRDWRDDRESAQCVEQGGRYGRDGSQRQHDDARGDGIRDVQPRICDRDARGKKSGARSRGSREELDDAREIPGLRGGAEAAPAVERAGDFRRDQVTERKPGEIEQETGDGDIPGLLSPVPSGKSLPKSYPLCSIEFHLDMLRPQPYT